MFTILIILVVYTGIILLFVPLSTIGKWQEKVRGWEKKAKDRVAEDKDKDK